MRIYVCVFKVVVCVYIYVCVRHYDGPTNTHTHTLNILKKYTHIRKNIQTYPHEFSCCLHNCFFNNWFLYNNFSLSLSMLPSLLPLATTCSTFPTPLPLSLYLSLKLFWIFDKRLSPLSTPPSPSLLSLVARSTLTSIYPQLLYTNNHSNHHPNENNKILPQPYTHNFSRQFLRGHFRMVHVAV